MSGDREKLHSAVLVAPAKERRRLRKQRRQAATELVAEQRQKERTQARERKAAERAERRATRYLPAAGESGPAMMRGKVRTFNFTWRCRESNPGPSTLLQGFSGRSLLCLYSAPVITQASTP